MTLPSRTPNRPKSVPLSSRAVSVKMLLKSEAVNFKYTQTPRTALHNKTFFFPFLLYRLLAWFSLPGPQPQGAAGEGQLSEGGCSQSPGCPRRRGALLTPAELQEVSTTAPLGTATGATRSDRQSRGAVVSGVHPGGLVWNSGIRGQRWD